MQATARDGQLPRPHDLLRWLGRSLRRLYSQLVDLAPGVRTTPAEPHGLLAPVDPALRSGGLPALILGDAQSCPTPDDVTIVLMYSSFTGETFDAVVKQIYASFERVPRQMTLIYINPIEHDFLVNSCRWLIANTIRGPRLTRKSAEALTVHVYRLKARRDAGADGVAS